MNSNLSHEPPGKPCRILYADHHPGMAAGVINHLKTHPHIKIAGHACNACTAMEMVEELQPDVVITSINMPGKNGIELAKEIYSTYPWIKVIIFSSSMDDQHITDAVDAGIMGYVLKTDDLSLLVQAIEKAMKGEKYLNAAVAARLLELLQHTGTNPIKTMQRHQHTDDEMAIMRENCNGLSVDEIAAKLNMEKRQVTAIKERLFKKVKCHNMVGLAMYAVRAYIVNPWRSGAGCIFYAGLLINWCW
ncbi:MAG: response regulator transcription factor [Flavisolibacter sp.]|nr:response regulator transcription factor [Flavisolibacter sp.]